MSDEFRVRVTAYHLRVRPSAGTSEPEVGFVHFGDLLLVLEESLEAARAKVGQHGEWLKVQAPDGQTEGWVAAWWVEPATDRPAGMVYRESDQFKLNGQEFQFVGVNVRGLLHYGNSAIDRVKHSTVNDVEGQLRAAAQDVKAGVARVFLAHNWYDHENRYRVGQMRKDLMRFLKLYPEPDLAPEGLPDSQLERAVKRISGSELVHLVLAKRLEHALARAQAQCMRLMVAFTDYNSEAGYWLRPDARFYEGYLNTQEWYERGCHQDYLALVKYIVRRFKDNPWVFAWELGNELKLPENPGVFIEFARVVTKQIWEIDPFHLIAPGVMSTRHCGFTADQALRFYELPHIDIVTVHAATGDCPQADGDEHARRRACIEHDLNVAQSASVKKPLVVEELGYRDGQVDKARDLMAHCFQAGVRGVLQWGFNGLPDGARLARDYDHMSMQKWGPGTGYAGLAAVYRKRAGHLPIPI